MEETNFFLKEEVNFLEQEKNKIRGEYYKITQCLGQEEKIKLKIRENEKEIERSEHSAGYYKQIINELEVQLRKEKDALKNPEILNLQQKLEEAKENKNKAIQKVFDITEAISSIEAEIESERKCENKVIPTNLKQEIKNLESEITEKTKEIKLKLLEKKKVVSLYEKMVSSSGINKKTVKKSTEIKNESPKKIVTSRSSTNFNAFDSGKRDLIVGLVGKSLAEGNPKDMKFALRTVGSQDQGITTKLVRLNREEFLKKLKFSK